MKVLVAQSCLTLCNPVDCSQPSSSVHGILQARTLGWVAIPFFRGSSWPRDWTQVSCITGRFFTGWAIREVKDYWPFLYDSVISSSKILTDLILLTVVRDRYHYPFFFFFFFLKEDATELWRIKASQLVKWWSQWSTGEVLDVKTVWCQSRQSWALMDVPSTVPSAWYASNKYLFSKWIHHQDWIR